MILAADILEPCLQNIMPTFAHLLIDDFQTATVHLTENEKRKTVLSKMGLQLLLCQHHHRRRRRCRRRHKI